jgi:hypothetical protein
MAGTGDPLSITGLKMLLRGGQRTFEILEMLEVASRLFRDQKQYPSGRPSEQLVRMSNAADRVAQALRDLEKAIDPPKPGEEQDVDPDEKQGMRYFEDDD